VFLIVGCVVYYKRSRVEEFLARKRTYIDAPDDRSKQTAAQVAPETGKTASRFVVTTDEGRTHEKQLSNTSAHEPQHQNVHRDIAGAESGESSTLSGAPPPEAFLLYQANLDRERKERENERAELDKKMEAERAKHTELVELERWRAKQAAEAMEAERKAMMEEHAKMLVELHKNTAGEHAKTLEEQRKATAQEHATLTEKMMERMQATFKMADLGWSRLSAECASRDLNDRGNAAVLADRLIAAGHDTASLSEEWNAKLVTLMKLEKHVAKSWTLEQAARVLAECKGNAADAQRKLSGENIGIGGYAEIAA
jgi:hypothetical protein